MISYDDNHTDQIDPNDKLKNNRKIIENNYKIYFNIKIINHPIEIKNVCAICLDELIEGTIATLNCGHSFCYLCISEWISKSGHGDCLSCRVRTSKVYYGDYVIDVVKVEED